MTMRLLLVALTLPLVSLRAQAPTPPAACEPIASDSARFGTTPVFAACEVDRAARPRGRPWVSGAIFPEGVTCLIAEFEFVVDERGAPIPASAVLRFASTPEFGAAAQATLSRWRYAPAQRQRTPVRQLVVGRIAQQEFTERRVPFTVVTVTGTPGAPMSAPPPPPPRGQPRTETGPCA